MIREILERNLIPFAAFFITLMGVLTTTWDESKATFFQKITPLGYSLIVFSLFIFIFAIIKNVKLSKKIKLQNASLQNIQMAAITELENALLNLYHPFTMLFQDYNTALWYEKLVLQKNLSVLTSDKFLMSLSTVDIRGYPSILPRNNWHEFIEYQGIQFSDRMNKFWLRYGDIVDLDLKIEINNLLDDEFFKNLSQLDLIMNLNSHVQFMSFESTFMGIDGNWLEYKSYIEKIERLMKRCQDAKSSNEN